MGVTIKDIAERAGVSFSTVSKALRNSPLVQEKTKRKVLAIAEQMGYVPNIAARKLVSNKSGSFGVIWPSVERATPSLLITKINELLENQGFTMLFSINRLESAIQAFNRFQTDAILVFYDRDEAMLHDPRIPTATPLLYYGNAGTTPFPTIDTKRGQAIALALRHLASLGHANIAYIGRPPYVDLLQEEKTDAFAASARELGLRERIVPVSSMEMHDGYLAAKELLQSEERPTAIIAGSYDLSRGILRAAGEAGLRVPEQLSVVGYDHIPQMGELDVPLTAVGVEVDLIADVIARSLAELADGAKLPPTVYLEPELVVRSSTAPCPPSGG